MIIKIFVSHGTEKTAAFNNEFVIKKISIFLRHKTRYKIDLGRILKNLYHSFISIEQFTDTLNYRGLARNLGERGTVVVVVSNKRLYQKEPAVWLGKSFNP